MKHVLPGYVNMQTLKDFYRAYADWLDAGAPQGKPFVRNNGLCLNLLLKMPRSYEETNAAFEEMTEQLCEAGLDTLFPFDTREEYSKCDNMHLNPRRIAWVRAHVEENDNV